MVIPVFHCLLPVNFKEATFPFLPSVLPSHSLHFLKILDMFIFFIVKCDKIINRILLLNISVYSII